jgi:hypothetical protein
MSSDRVLNYLLLALGSGIGTLSTSLLYEIAPSLVQFKEGVDPTLQGASVGLTIGLLLATAVVFTEMQYE